MLGKASGKYRDFFSEGKQTDTIIEKRKEEKSGVCVCMHVIERERERECWCAMESCVAQEFQFVVELADKWM